MTNDNWKEVKIEKQKRKELEFYPEVVLIWVREKFLRVEWDTKLQTHNNREVAGWKQSKIQKSVIE
jgi:hypothetical protein